MDNGQLTIDNGQLRMEIENEEGNVKMEMKSKNEELRILIFLSASHNYIFLEVASDFISKSSAVSKKKKRSFFLFPSFSRRGNLRSKWGG